MGIETKIFVLITMIFCHICDDYYLQGILASLKQREWWQTNAPDNLYKYDYIVALLMHAFSWSFMVLIPAWIATNCSVTWNMLVLFIFNAIIHATVDDLKANHRVINLITDQSIHIAQIIVAWMVIV